MAGIKVPSLQRASVPKAVAVRIAQTKLPATKPVNFKAPQEPTFERAPEVSGDTLPRRSFRPMKQTPTQTAPHWSGKN